jgi:Zn-finger nucleic acid-binding protein
MIRVASARKREVIIETCPDCRGVWLDGGELKELLRA